ncbi:MAG: hypothetical protein AAGA65_04690 [Actinomycetota bacterium]
MMSSPPNPITPRTGPASVTASPLTARRFTRRRRVVVVRTLLGVLVPVVLVVSVVSVVPMLLSGAAVAAQAQPDCSRTVADTSGVVDIDVVVAATTLVDPAATIVVRSYDRVEGGDLVGTVDELVSRCYAGDGDIQPDVIVLAVSVGDRQSDVVIGGRWRPAIPDPDDLRIDVMGRFFSEDDFTGGLEAGVREVAVAVADRLTTEAEAAASASDEQEDQSDGDGDEDEDTADTGSAADTTGDGGDDGQSPWAVGGALAAAAAGGGAFLVISRQRRLSGARDELQRAMADPIARQGTLRARDARLVTQADGWAHTTAGRTTEALAAAVADLDETRSGTDRTRLVLSRIIPDGPAKADLGEVQRANAALVELSQALDQHDDALGRLEELGAHFDHLRVAVPAKAQLLDEELDESEELADQRASEGWAVESQRSELRLIAAGLDQMVMDGLAHDLLSLSERVEALEADLFRTNHYLQSLPSRLGSLRQWTDGLDQAAELEQRRIDQQRRDFVSLSTTHASESWRWAADLPEQALDHIARSDAIQERVITELVSRQEFDQAGRELDAAGLELIAADRLLDRVDDLIVDLETAKEAAPQLVAESREVLRSFAEFIDGHRGDLDTATLTAPSDVSDAIAGVEQELRQPKPNYLRAAESANGINRQLDELLRSAKEQHLRMESLRRELGRETERAKRAISRARRSIGWELFPSRDGRALDELERSLGRLPDDVEVAIDRAGDVADDALRIQERVIARRRRQSTWVSTGGGGWSSGGGGWSSGGSSGRSRSGGGRSFSRSMSRSGGGRSFGSGRSSGRF